jgi:hypothetical protein
MLHVGGVAGNLHLIRQGMAEHAQGAECQDDANPKLLRKHFHETSF